MIEWLNTWTFFNWLALIAFIFGAISVFNAVLTLRSRYKDWRATKSKKAFHERITELLKQVDKVEGFRKNPTLLVIDIIEDLIPVAAILIGSFIFLLFLFVEYYPIGDSRFEQVRLPIAYMGIVMTMLVLMIPLSDLANIYILIRYFKKPGLMVARLTQLIMDGEKKNLITLEEVAPILKKVIDKEMYKEIGVKEAVEQYKKLINND